MIGRIRESRLAGLVPCAEPISADWEHLATFRTQGTPGFTRSAFTTAYFDAHVWLAERMVGAGLEASIDAAGNLVGAPRRLTR